MRKVLQNPLAEPQKRFCRILEGGGFGSPGPPFEDWLFFPPINGYSWMKVILKVKRSLKKVGNIRN